MKDFWARCIQPSGQPGPDGWNYMALTAPDSRLAEIRRVLRPGGQVGIGFWIEQRDIDWMVELFKRCLPNQLAEETR